MLPKSFIAIVALLALVALAAGPAQAGNIFLTGHDDDYHFVNDGSFGGGASGPAGQQLAAAFALVRNGSSLPVLSFDSGTELTAAMTALGIPFTNVNPNTASNVTDALFDPTRFSAFAVASQSSCGGCDNSPGGPTNIAAHSTAIQNFFNAGGGILALAGASDTGAYAFVPTSATNAGGNPPSTGYVQTASGASLGIPAVNGDPTHNFFSEPGTSGLSSAYSVVERLTSATTGTPESVALAGGTIVCTGPSCSITVGPSVPEPATLVLLGAGLLGFGVRRFWIK